MAVRRLCTGSRKKEQLAKNLKAAYEACVEYLDAARENYLKQNSDYYEIIRDFEKIIYLMGPLPILPYHDGLNCSEGSQESYESSMSD